MKKMLFTAVSALALAGVAIAADSTQFGVLYVPSTAKETIVAVPWLASGTADSSVKVADLVLTAGLTENDELKYYTGSGYLVWQLKSGGWEPATTVTDTKVSAAAGADEASLTRGQSIILKRSNPNNKGFYIMGKPATASADPLNLPDGEMNAPVWTLVAPPKVEDTNVNTGLTWTNLAAWKDQLYIDRNGTMEILTWNGSQWGGPGTSTFKIPEGQGAWFCGRGVKKDASPSTKSVAWN